MKLVPIGDSGRGSAIRYRHSAQVSNEAMGTNKAMIFVHRHPVHTSTECRKVYTDYGNGYITCTECHSCYPNWALGTSVVPNALSIMNDMATSTKR